MQTFQISETSHPNPTPSVDDETLLTSAQVRARVGGVSTMCLWRWTRDERVKFPAPDVVINSRKYWYAGTIRQFNAGRATKADA